MDAGGEDAGPRIAVAVSSCLLGERVRYDGRDKRDAWICEGLARVFDLIAVCPEVAIGLGVPRPPIRLVQGGQGARAQRVDDPQGDVTEPLERYAGVTASGPGRTISGYVFKGGSPSCGLAGVPLYTPAGLPAGTGGGVFAAGLTARLPYLPVSEEGGLAGAAPRLNFIERVQVYYRWQALCRGGLSQRALIGFHGRHELMLLARDEPGYRRLGRLLAEGSEKEINKTSLSYIALMTDIMKVVPRRGGHVNALQHAAGFLSGLLGPAERAALAGAIDDYRQGRAELARPLAAIRARLADRPRSFLAGQYYFSAHGTPPDAE